MPLPAITAPIAQLGTGIIGGISNLFTRIAQKRQAKKSHERNLEMWKMQNAYDHPAQQMQRLKEAGLNPHLVYGKGSIANTSASMPQHQNPGTQFNSVPFADPAGMLNAYMDIKTKKQNLDNMEAQREAINQQTALNAAKAALAIQDKGHKGELHKYNLQYKQRQNTQLAANIVNTIAQSHLTEAKLKQQKFVTSESIRTKILPGDGTSKILYRILSDPEWRKKIGELKNPFSTIGLSIGNNPFKN